MKINLNSTSISYPLETSAQGEVGIPVYIQDQTAGILDLPFIRHIGSVSLAADTVVDSRYITLTPGHGLTTGNSFNDVMELSDPLVGSHFMQSHVVSIAGDVVFLDSPVNRVYPAATGSVTHSTASMNVDGSSTPVVFAVKPDGVQKGDLVRMILDLRDNTAMDFESFGGISALTNGCVIRINNGDGTYRHLNNFKSNGDIIEQAFDHSFLTNNGGSGRGFTARLTWGGPSKHGVVIRLNSARGESLEFVVQDNLTGLTQMHWSCQGHELQNVVT